MKTKLQTVAKTAPVGGAKKNHASAPRRKPKRADTDISSRARQHTTAALEAFVAVMQDAGAPAAARVAAATQILTWGYGKAAGGEDDAAPKTVKLAWQE